MVAAAGSTNSGGSTPTIRKRRPVGPSKSSVWVRTSVRPPSTVRQKWCVRMTASPPGAHPVLVGQKSRPKLGRTCRTSKNCRVPGSRRVLHSGPRADLPPERRRMPPSPRRPRFQPRAAQSPAPAERGWTHLNAPGLNNRSEPGYGSGRNSIGSASVNTALVEPTPMRE